VAAGVLLATALTGSVAVTGAGATTGAVAIGGTPTGLDQAPTYRANDFADGNALSILPPGENGLVNPAQAVGFEAAGQRPPASQDQLGKYAGLLYASPGLTDTGLGSYYDDASFGVRPQDVTRVEHPSASQPVTIYRDGHDMPHVYGSSDGAAAFGIGFAQAEDRLFLMDVLRHYGQATLSEFLGPSCAFEQMDHDELLLAPYTEQQAQAQLDALPHEYGAAGVQLKAMLGSYVAGVNAYVAQTRTDPSLLPADYAAALAPPQLWQPSDVIYVAALIGGIFGRGGGAEVRNAALLGYLQRQLGASPGAAAFGDLKEQNDPGAPTTITDQRFPYDIPGRVDPATTALPDQPGAPLRGGPTTTTANCDLTKPNPTALQDAIGLLALPRQMSNALLVDAHHSASGRPVAVMGPQVGYFAPQILMVEDVHAPGYQAEGASFPGTGLVELGRGEDYAWSATSAGSDNTDQRLEQICDPAGGAPAPQGHSYMFDGKCLPMEHHTFTEVAVPKPGGLGAPTVVTRDVYLTVHGIVQGWTTADHGKPVAVVNQRSTYNHEADSGVGFIRWADPGRTHDVGSWMTGAEQINYTFNWFYVDNKDIGYEVSGWDPVRPANVDPNLPTWGTGASEWRGFLPASQHPHEVDPPQGFLTSWNNKPAPAFSAADDDYSMGLVQRVQSLMQEIHHQLDLHNGKITRANLATAMETAASVDLDGRQVLPELLAFETGRPASAGVTTMLGQLRGWLAAGAQRHKAAPSDTQYRDSAAVAIMDELEPRLVRALFDPIFAGGGVQSQNGVSSGYTAMPMEQLVSSPNGGGSHQGDAYGSGWEGYAQKMLRQLDGQPVAQPFSSAVSGHVCGPGGLADCGTSVGNALQATYDALVAANGGNSVSSWTADTATKSAGVSMPVYDDIEAQTLGLVGQPAIDWQNRPTFQQAVEFPRHRPR
jgi:acyl-homoserine lactone acylase PvdQ